MSGFGSASTRPLYGRGPAAGLRFTGYALLSLTLMYCDQRALWSERLRYGLLALAYPVQVAVGSPVAGWRALTGSLETRRALMMDNAALRARLRAAEIAAMRVPGLEQENRDLRALRAAQPPLVRRWQYAEVISVESNPLRQRLIINKGANDGVFLNQAVVDANGILGQVAGLGPWSAEVILLTDPEHALPVQVTRNQLRTIAVGAGVADELVLPYVAVNADVRKDDLLVSSGLGGVFPAGYPVARVIGVSREKDPLLAQVRAVPLARPIDVREVMLIEFDPRNSAAPANAAAIAALAPKPAKPAPVRRSSDPDDP